MKERCQACGNVQGRPHRSDCPERIESLEESQQRTIIALAARAQCAEDEAPKTIATEAQKLVYGDRNAAYGTVTDNFGRIAGLWNALFSDKLVEGKQFNVDDIAAAMRLVKEARLHFSPDHHDSLVDIVGYALTQEQYWKERDGRI